MDIFTRYSGAEGRGPSYDLWKKMPPNAPTDFNAGVYLRDDFLAFDGLVSSNVGRYFSESGGWRSYEDTGGSITQLAAARTGVLNITTDNTDNDEAWLQSGGATGNLGEISDTAGADLLMIYEARVKFTQIGDTYNAFFGLAEEGLAAADTVTNAGAMASKDFIGFRVLEGDGDSLEIVYRKAGQAEVEVMTFATPLVADQWYKFGFIYDPQEQASQRIAFYIDGVRQTSYVSATNIAAATFPDGEKMGLLSGVKNGGAAISGVQWDWVQFFQKT